MEGRRIVLSLTQLVVGLFIDWHLTIQSMRAWPKLSKYKRRSKKWYSLNCGHDGYVYKTNIHINSFYSRCHDGGFSWSIEFSVDIFSAPEPKVQVHYCDHALSVVRRPSVRPSSVVVNFSHFRHLLWNPWTEFNETWQEARSQCPLPSLCFSGRSEKQDGRAGLWLAETFLTSPLKPLNGIQRNLTGSKISTSSTKFVFFRPIGKTKWRPWPLIGWHILDFSSETAQLNLTKLGRKQDLNVLYQVCVFRANRKNKMAALASDWLRHVGLLLLNRWTEFNETWRKQDLNVLYQVCVFRADR